MANPTVMAVAVVLSLVGVSDSWAAQSPRCAKLKGGPSDGFFLLEYPNGPDINAGVNGQEIVKVLKQSKASNELWAYLEYKTLENKTIRGWIYNSYLTKHKC